ncbi:MAG: hypothetical protein E7395_07905 [Ruminococcaceae bacterium]|nr:hypothetical protein [Oscillospiraceae bacterium]
MKKLGIEVTFVDSDSDEATLNTAFRENAKAMFGETIANPALVVHSTTKYMDGHVTSVGGAVVDSGNFDWNAAVKE